MSEETVEGLEHDWLQKKHSAPTLFSCFNKGLGTETPAKVIRDAVLKVIGGDFSGRFGLEWQLKKYTTTGQGSDAEYGKLRQHLMDRVKAILGTSGVSCETIDRTSNEEQFVAPNELAKLIIHFQRKMSATDVDLFQFIDAFLVAALGDKAREVVEEPITSLQCPTCQGWKSYVIAKDGAGYLCVACGTAMPNDEACFRKVKKCINETYLQLCRKMLGQFGPERDASAASAEREPIQWIPTEKVKLALELVRDIETDAVNDLAESIKSQGVLHPITVRPLEDGCYEVAAGGHRFTALTAVLGWPKLPCIVKHLNADEAKLLGISENIQRNVNLDPVREGQVFARLIDTKAWTVEAIARRIGKNVTYVNDRISVFRNLEPKIQRDLSSGSINMANAKWIARQPQTKQVEIIGKLKRFPNVPRASLVAPDTECTHSCPCHCPPKNST